MVCARRSQRGRRAAKRRDAVKAQIEGSALPGAEAVVKSWTPQGASREANEVDQPEARLAAANDVSASTATTQATAALQGPSLQRYLATRELVLRTQRLLNKLGYDVGAPDGELGERTREAIRAFQERNGIPASGEVTLPLVTKLERHSPGGAPRPSAFADREIVHRLHIAFFRGGLVPGPRPA